MRELAGITVGGPSGTISGATIGMAVGMVLGPGGMVLGTLIGGAVDIFMGAKAAKKARKKMEAAFVQMLIKRYETQIFVSTLERMGSAITYLTALRLQPGTQQFDDYLKRLLYTEAGYKGNCELDLWGPAAAGKPRTLLAKIDKNGKLTPVSQNIDLGLGPQWNKACKDIHKAALKDWAVEQQENIDVKRALTEEKQESTRSLATKLLVNASLILMMIGYTVRTKKKLKKLRSSHAETE